MKIKLTRTGESGQCGSREEILFSQDMEGVENQVVNLYPGLRFEKFEGFGGAVTDSAAYVYSMMGEEDRKNLMETYFSPGGMNYRLVRIHMDSCDFSTGMYEAVTDPEDHELKTFSFERTEKYIIPMLRDAQKAAGRDLEIMLSPWSPPAFMKTNGSRKNGGHLRPEFADMWAGYMCRYILEFRKRGFWVRRISLQNEPKAVQTWDSCVYSAAREKEFLEEHLYPALIRNHMDDIEVFIWDHNKERAYERAAEIVHGKAVEMVSGVACHWYSGDHFENLDLLRRFFPDLKLIISESCIEYSKFSEEDEFVKAAGLSHEIIGDLNHGITAFYDWNLLLDEKGGPNHVGNYCQAPFLYDTCKKELVPQKILDHFYHFAHYIRPGADRIGFSRYTDRIGLTAYVNPDGKTVFVMLNRGDEEIPVNLRMNGMTAAFTVGAREICTGVTVN